MKRFCGKLKCPLQVVYIEISEDQLPSWNNDSKRAAEVIDIMWVLRKKKDEKGNLLKYKARAVVCGNQQKHKALASGSEHSHPRNLRASCAFCHFQAPVRRGMHS
eukprot:4660216-Pleurochrysis_carterae.AAC.1